MHFGLVETIARTMAEILRVMEIACNSIFTSIVIAKVIADSRGVSL